MLSKGCGECTLSFCGLAWLKLTISATQHKRQQQFFWGGGLRSQSTLCFSNLSCARTDCSFSDEDSAAKPKSGADTCVPFFFFFFKLTLTCPATAQSHSHYSTWKCHMQFWPCGLRVIDERAALMEVPGCSTAAEANVRAERSGTSAVIPCSSTRRSVAVRLRVRRKREHRFDSVVLSSLTAPCSLGR